MSDYDRGKKNRLPSYTDRVLYKRHQHYRYPLHLLYYHDFRDVTVSDHKPVLAMLAVGTPFAAEVKKHLAERLKMELKDGSGGGTCGCCG